jgi:hypothetical protein
VAKLSHVMADVGVHKGIVVAMGGCRSGATQAAEQLGIELWDRDEVAHRLGPDAVATAPLRPKREQLAVASSVPPQHALGVLQKQGRRFIGIGSEELAWHEAGWLPVFELQVAATRRKPGLRNRLAVTRSWNLYEALTGTLMGVRDNPTAATDIDVANRAVGPLLRESKVPTELRSAVERYRKVTSDSAIARHAATLHGLGVTTPLEAIDVEATRLVYYPFLIGLLKHKGTERIVVVSGVTGNVVPTVGLAASSHVRHVANSLGH